MNTAIENVMFFMMLTFEQYAISYALNVRSLFRGVYDNLLYLFPVGIVARCFGATHDCLL